jgi:hypothetical protein
MKKIEIEIDGVTVTLRKKEDGWVSLHIPPIHEPWQFAAGFPPSSAVSQSWPNIDAAYVTAIIHDLYGKLSRQ